MPEEIKFLMFGKDAIGLSTAFSRKFLSAEKIEASAEPVRAKLESDLKAVLSDRLKPREQRVKECLGFFHEKYRGHEGLHRALTEAARRIENEEPAFLIKHDGATGNPKWAWQPLQELSRRPGAAAFDF